MNTIASRIIIKLLGNVAESPGKNPLVDYISEHATEITPREANMVGITLATELRNKLAPEMAARVMNALDGEPKAACLRSFGDQTRRV